LNTGHWSTNTQILILALGHKIDMLSISILINIDPGALWQSWRYAWHKT